MATGDGWGFFIFDEFLVMMCADGLVLAISAIFNSALVQLTGEPAPPASAML